MQIQFSDPQCERLSFLTLPLHKLMLGARIEEAAPRDPLLYMQTAGVDLRRTFYDLEDAVMRDSGDRPLHYLADLPTYLELLARRKSWGVQTVCHLVVENETVKFNDVPVVYFPERTWHRITAIPPLTFAVRKDFNPNRYMFIGQDPKPKLIT